jgi:hypothetical protein
MKFMWVATVLAAGCGGSGGKGGAGPGPGGKYQPIAKTPSGAALTFDTPQPLPAYGDASASAGGAPGQAETGSATTTPATPTASGGVAAVRTFRFEAKERRVLPGDGAAPGDQFGCDDDGEVPDSERIGNLALLASFAQNACYTDGRYNARDFPVEVGEVVASDGARYEAYAIHAPQTPPSVFTASQHDVFLRFGRAAPHTLYVLEGDGVVARATLGAGDISDLGFSKLPIDANSSGAGLVFFVQPSDVAISSLSPLAPGVSGADLPTTALGALTTYRYAVGGTPFDTRAGFAWGPADASNVYSDLRHLFPVELTGGVLGVVWQDQATHEVRITTIGADRATLGSATIANPGNDVLAAATSDGGGRVYMFFVQDNDPGGRAQATRTTRLLRADLIAGTLAEALADASEEGLNINFFGRDNVASMAYAGGKVGLMIGRTMHQSSDGLNHQGGIAVIFDGESLKVEANHGQTSGHSFENVLHTGDDGGFYGIDLGDNYPRGVHLHHFDATTRDSIVSFTFKTEHGQTPQSPAGASYPRYDAISGSKIYYQWSNDNLTYTELGGVVQDAGGYTVVFASEPRGGRALDNGRAGDYLVDARNIGLVRIRRDFKTLQQWGNEVQDAAVLSSGAVETGGFYTFGGHWSPQRNAGVVWLTASSDVAADNASRVRAVGLGDGNLLVMWEQWTNTSYVTTRAMKVDPLGRVLIPATELGPRVRLGRRDDLLVRGNDVYVVAGQAAEQALDVTVLSVQ